MHTKIIIALLLISLTGCQIADWQKITHYNDEVTTTNDSVYVKGKRVGDAVAKGVLTGDYRAVKTNTDSMEIFVKKQITFFSKQLEIKGSNSMRVAELQYLQFEEQVIQQQFTKLALLNARSTGAEVKGILAELGPIAEKDHAYFDRITTLQEQYARLNGFPYTKGTYRSMFQ